MTTTPALTRRELRHLNALARGLTDPVIAVELGVTPRVVRNYATRLYRKLGVTTRIDAAAAGRRLGLVSGRCPMCGHREPSEGRTGVRAGTETPGALSGGPGAAGGPR